jgi:hypothetical protein
MAILQYQEQPCQLVSLGRLALHGVKKRHELFVGINIAGFALLKR